MPRKKKRGRAKPRETYTSLGIRVDRYEVRLDASINYHVHQPQHASHLYDDDPLFRHVSELTIVGVSTYPDQRAGDRYEVSVYAEDTPSSRVHSTLKDAQVRDKYGAPAYRTYRGGQVPVYNTPSGFGLIEKVRGEPGWTAWVHLAPRLVTDMLILLGHQRQLYLGIQERKANRTRWVYSIALQTTDPAEDE